MKKVDADDADMSIDSSEELRKYELHRILISPLRLHICNVILDIEGT